MNQFNFIGNLTRDPELTETAKGVKVCRFDVAVNRDYVDSDGNRKVDFFKCVAWRGKAETAAKYLKKGNKIQATASIETRTYEDANGIKKTAFDVVISKIEFLTSHASAEDDAASNKLQPINDDSDIPF